MLTPCHHQAGVLLREVKGHRSRGGEAHSLKHRTQLELAWGFLGLQRAVWFSGSLASRCRWDATEELRMEWGPTGLNLARAEGEEGLRLVRQG